MVWFEFIESKLKVTQGQLDPLVPSSKFDLYSWLKFVGYWENKFK